MATYSNAVKKVYQIYFSKLGTILETFGDTHLNAQDDEVAVIKAFIEDGVVDNVTTLVNFTPEGRTAFTSHWFPMFYRGLQEKIVSGEAEPRTFAQFEITLPSIVLLMNGGKTSVSQSMTVIQRYGSIHLGNFATITDLNTDNPASETYFDDSVVAFVYSNEAGQTDQVGFYQVEEVEEVWTWVLKTTLLYALSTKQYNGATFTVGRGPSNPQGVPTVSQSLIYQLMQEISYLDIGYQSLDVDMTDLQDKVEALRDGSLPIEFDNLDTNLVAVEVEQAIKEVNTKSNVNIQDINDIVSGQKAFTEILLSDGDGGEARLTYDGTDPILSYRGITGEMFKNLFLEVEPASGVTFSNGMNVMYAGSIGGSGKRLAKPTVLSELAVNPSLYLGMITQVTTDGYGVVNWYGVVNSLNTSGLTLGADVYVGDGGAFTTTKPISPLPQIEIGLIERVNPANGAISLRPNVGRYLNGLHDVYTNGHTFVGGETIMFNITNGRYEIYDLAGNILRIDNDILRIDNDIDTLQSTKVPKTTTIIGLDLQDNILIGEFRTALGNATQSVAGLLSAEDKTHLDGLVALLETSDGDTIVDTIGEILAIFQNYPEGADLVTVLQGKVDKVVGKELSTNDFTDLLKAKLDSLLDGTQYYDKTYIDSLKNMNGWESELLGTLSNNGTIALSIINQYNEIQMYAKDTLGVIDNENIRPSLIQSGDSVYFFDDTQAFIMVDTVFGFYAPVGYTLQVVGLKYTELKAVETTYNNVTSGLDAENVQEAIDELQDEKVDKTAIVDNLITDDATKVLSAKQGKVLQDTKEALVNKATDFSVVNDTKYPTTKAVAERLLNLPIAELNNHTLREVFEGGNLVSMTLSEWQTTFGTVITSTDDILRATVSTVSLSNGMRTVANVLTLNNDYYLKLQFKPYRTHNMLLFIGNGYVNTNINATANIFNDISYQFNVMNDTDKKLTFNNNGNSLTDTVIGVYSEFKEIYFINRTSLGISALTVQQMDYWFSVYQALLVSDTNAIFSMFASKTLEAWLTPTLTGATTTYLKYRKDTLGSVIVEGNITVTTAGTNLTLPTGYRPLFSYTVGILTFNTDGTVVSSSTGTQTLSIRFTGGA